MDQNDDLDAAGREIGARLRQPDTQAVILLGCGIRNGKTVFAEALLNAVHSEIPEALIAGGQAGDNGQGRRTLVFTGEGVTDRGVAAASLAGPDLSAFNAYTLSWVPIGKKMYITQVEGSRVYAIDGKPPYEIYCHYLGQDVADGLPLAAADFPLMLERDGVLMAIHATGVNPDGSFEYIHNFHPGEELRFGYCHAGLLALGAERLREELVPMGAEAIFVYSCVSRKWILGADVMVELQPLCDLAPCAGFFCYGEYFGRPDSRPLFLSQTLTVLGLAEQGGAGRSGEVRSMPGGSAQMSKQFKTMRVLHRLIETSAREIEAMNEELANLARRDSLTGLANRRLFDERLVREMKRHSRSGAPLSLIMLDLDRFKEYNDTYGHVSGDNCLRGVSEVLKTVLKRASDLAARYGGEEFAVILPDTGHQAATFLAEELRKAIEDLHFPHSGSDASPWITASLGVVTAYFVKDAEPEAFIHEADRQLYLAKSSGRNQVASVELPVEENGDPLP
jgi:diguanylate cyclase (GGDEF)-like protein